MTTTLTRIAIVEALRDCGIWLHVNATGGGAGVQSLLWSVPGTSAFLSGAGFTYSCEETDRFLGYPLRNVCPSVVSREATIRQALAAFLAASETKHRRLRERRETLAALAANVDTAPYEQARQAFGRLPCVGLAINASLATQAAHRGDHRVHIAVVTPDGAWTCDVVLPKAVGFDARQNDGALCDQVALDVLLMVLTRDNPSLCPGRLSDQPFTVHSVSDEELRAAALEYPVFRVGGTREVTLDSGRRWTLLPATMNPLHYGHVGMARALDGEDARDVAFVVTTEPVHDKPRPSATALLDRVAQGHAAGFTVVLTDLARYIDMAEQWPKCHFAIGVDAAIRMLDPKWYGTGTTQERNRVLDRFRRRYVIFHVFGREIDGLWMAPETVDHPTVSDLFQYERGRWDVSSSTIRAAQGT